LPIDRKLILKAVEEAKKNAKKRKFTQTIDLVINLKEIDLKIPENRINELLELPEVNLKYKVIQKGKLIYYNEINTYYQFKASVILEFLDFNPIFNFYQRILYKKVGISHA